MKVFFSGFVTHYHTTHKRQDESERVGQEKKNCKKKIVKTKITVPLNANDAAAALKVIQPLQKKIMRTETRQ